MPTRAKCSLNLGRGDGLPPWRHGGPGDPKQGQRRDPHRNHGSRERAHPWIEDDGLNPGPKRAPCWQDADEVQAKPGRRQGGFHLEQVVSVGGPARGRLAAQYLFVASRLAIRARPEEGQPQQRIEPMHRQQAAEQRIDPQVSVTEVQQFVPQHQPGFLRGKVVLKALVQQPHRPPQRVTPAGWQRIPEQTPKHQHHRPENRGAEARGQHPVEAQGHSVHSVSGSAVHRLVQQPFEFLHLRCRKPAVAREVYERRFRGPAEEALDERLALGLHASLPRYRGAESAGARGVCAGLDRALSTKRESSVRTVFSAQCMEGFREWVSSCAVCGDDPHSASMTAHSDSEMSGIDMRQSLHA